ncbi:hypothetical protein P154DRAFT_621583 [Amniculicola lignicola CBS 123094]|uniref:Uncharacterized protein n=1 Tax=Amniculicola lignicola CBS 123094 TaxID=1392246 RepID=A0A6A5WCY3_9PLEO|nr:hypothetical protein P154DRAFT_621583 [Amniculicola lignicola CBS 123094]
MSGFHQEITDANSAFRLPGHKMVSKAPKSSFSPASGQNKGKAKASDDNSISSPPKETLSEKYDAVNTEMFPRPASKVPGKASTPASTSQVNKSSKTTGASRLPISLPRFGRAGSHIPPLASPISSSVPRNQASRIGTKPTNETPQFTVDVHKPLPSPPIAQVVNPVSPAKTSRTLVDATVAGTPADWPILKPHTTRNTAQRSISADNAYMNRGSEHSSSSSNTSFGSRNPYRTLIGDSPPSAGEATSSAPRAMARTASPFPFKQPTYVESPISVDSSAFGSPLAYKNTSSSNKIGDDEDFLDHPSLVEDGLDAPRAEHYADDGGNNMQIADRERSTSRFESDSGDYRINESTETVLSSGVRVKRLSSQSPHSGYGPVLTIAEDADDIIYGTGADAPDVPSLSKSVSSNIIRERPLSALADRISRGVRKAGVDRGPNAGPPNPRSFGNILSDENSQMRMAPASPSASPGAFGTETPISTSISTMSNTPRFSKSGVGSLTDRARAMGTLQNRAVSSPLVGTPRYVPRRTVPGASSSSAGSPIGTSSSRKAAQSVNKTSPVHVQKVDHLRNPLRPPRISSLAPSSKKMAAVSANTPSVSPVTKTRIHSAATTQKATAIVSESVSGDPINSHTGAHAHEPPTTGSAVSAIQDDEFVSYSQSQYLSHIIANTIITSPQHEDLAPPPPPTMSPPLHTKNGPPLTQNTKKITLKRSFKVLFRKRKPSMLDPSSANTSGSNTTSSKRSSVTARAGSALGRHFNRTSNLLPTKATSLVSLSTFSSSKCHLANPTKLATTSSQHQLPSQKHPQPQDDPDRPASAQTPPITQISDTLQRREHVLSEIREQGVIQDLIAEALDTQRHIQSGIQAAEVYIRKAEAQVRELEVAILRLQSLLSGRDVEG